LTAAVATCLLVLLGACGNPVGKVLGHGESTPTPSAQSGGEGGSGGVAGADPTASAARGGHASPGGGHATPGAGGSGQPAFRPGASPTTYPQYAPNTSPAPVTATLTKECVQPAGTETLNIHGLAQMYVSFDAQYSDGKDGRQYGGSGTGETDATGNYTNTFVVSPTAPAGTVTVWVAAIDQSGKATAFRQPTFTVASHC
jgi:hypothetical protein